MKTVIAFGTFDPLHPGHVHFLQQAKKLGHLIVVISHEDKVRNNKNREPRESDQVRKQKVEELKIADLVLVGDPGNNYKILERIEPDIIALGYDQQIPKPLKNKVKKYKIITFSPYKADKYKSSLLGK